MAVVICQFCGEAGATVEIDDGKHAHVGCLRRSHLGVAPSTKPIEPLEAILIAYDDARNEEPQDPIDTEIAQTRERFAAALRKLRLADCCASHCLRCGAECEFCHGVEP